MIKNRFFQPSSSLPRLLRFFFNFFLPLFQFSLTFWFQDLFSILIILFCFPFSPFHLMSFSCNFSPPDYSTISFSKLIHSFLFCFSLSLIFILRTSNWGMKEKRWIWIKEQELTRRKIHSFSGTERERERKKDRELKKEENKWNMRKGETDFSRNEPSHDWRGSELERFFSKESKLVEQNERQTFLSLSLSIKYHRKS